MCVQKYVWRGPYMQGMVALWKEQDVKEGGKAVKNQWLPDVSLCGKEDWVMVTTPWEYLQSYTMTAM